MQTVKKIQAEMDELFRQNPPQHAGTKEYEDAARRVKFLKECLAYLQSKPTEEFVNKQLATLTKKLEARINGYQDWRNSQQTTKQKTDQQWQSQYNSEMGTSHIREQIKNIEYILS